MATRRSRTTRSSFRKQARTRGQSRGGGGGGGGESKGAVRYVLPAAIVAGLALLLWPSISSAANPPNPNPNPPNPGPGPQPGPQPGPSPFPAGSGRGVVRVTTGETGLNVRSTPDPNRGDTNFLGSVPNGTTVGVIETGVVEVGAPPGSPVSWWQIQTPGGLRGYVRAVGPSGEPNLTLTSPPQTPATGRLLNGVRAAFGPRPAHPYARFAG